MELNNQTFKYKFYPYSYKTQYQQYSIVCFDLKIFFLKKSTF